MMRRKMGTLVLTVGSFVAAAIFYLGVRGLVSYGTQIGGILLACAILGFLVLPEKSNFSGNSASGSR